MKRFYSAIYFIASIMFFGFEPKENASMFLVVILLAFAIINLAISAILVKKHFKETLK